ncbi:Metallo-dependent phosphatase [Gloeophyllum trabeum ATCC 11539]|uniref:Metallo-dependent phosphatase n=1 Tax=Gloeophyllum trabeum (strain ATCC 11539 / FP-39264 / Madison 617) TaxID=670483 RepID=S7Q754_GLOTA|nr:Metallo-dependent phosphatase [Gloeophyllum trabeum ATCC 11539]EPQ55273.1 Metallo-dependent phosphatase [Gloeophyllum trabeum ATCC 11539]
MKEIALRKGVDLLLVDSGDLHDGTGLSDGYGPGGVDAHDSNGFIAQLPYDVMAIGNHELYDYVNTYDMHTNFVPKLNGRYLSSNANITVYDKNNNSVSVPVGDRYAKFKTLRGRKVTALGVLFDFTGNDVNTTVQKVEDMVKEAWFADAIRDEPDFFLLAGHMPVARDKWPVVFDAVRAVHPHTPILILGGHTHIRDCNQPDGRSMALESGRYMETVGWMSVNLDKPGSTGNLTFTRRYLDPNRVTYQYHTSTSNSTFDTAQGTAITQGLLDLAQKYDLSYQYGVAPHDFTISQAPYPSENSSLSLFIQKAAPVALTINNTRAGIPNIMITNSGSQRFDVYAGPFTKNDQLTASPYTNAFVYIPNVTYGIASQVLPTMNKAGAEQRKRELLEEWEGELYGKGEVAMVYRRWLREMDEVAKREVGRREAVNGTLGYVTHDSCPGIGDDTYHTPLAYYDTPDFIGSDAPANISASDPIDLVFVSFNADQVLETLNALQTEKNYTRADMSSYTPILSNEVLGLYAERAWNSSSGSSH